MNSLFDRLGNLLGKWLIKSDEVDREKAFLGPNRRFPSIFADRRPLGCDYTHRGGDR